MQKIIPFKSGNEAVATLDNGGRFYNLLTKADDGVISVPELGKVAGLFSDKQKMVIYFAMSVLALDANSAEQIQSALSADLKTAYLKYQPLVLTASQAELTAVVSSSAIITGIPKHVESKSDFNGFVMVPVMAGKAVTFVLIPIIDRYDVYQIKDEDTSAVFFIAHARGTEKLPEEKIKVGGIIKELTTKKEGTELKKKFLEAFYYADVD